MNYGELLSRAWNIIWEHKYLILLGVLVALGSGTGNVSNTVNYSFDGGPRDAPRMPDFPRIPDLPQMPGPRTVAPIVIILAIAAAIVAIAVGLALWVVSTIARGGLIAGASTVDGGGSSGFVEAWNAGWRKGWRLLGIGILPAIPAFLLVIIGVLVSLAAGGFAYFLGEDVIGVPFAGLGVIVAAFACVLVPLILILGLLSTFANRACMLEDLGVLESYRRGVEVLFANFGPALVLFLIQIGIGLALAIVGFVPGILLTLCCILWPLLLLIRGAISAYFSTLWTVAWRRWTGLGQVEEAALQATAE